MTLSLLFSETEREAELAGSVEKIKIDKMSVIDSGKSGSGVASAASQFPEAIIKLTEQIETATGVNILARLKPADGGTHPARK